MQPNSSSFQKRTGGNNSQGAEGHEPLDDDKSPSEGATKAPMSGTKLLKQGHDPQKVGINQAEQY